MNRQKLEELAEKELTNDDKNSLTKDELKELIKEKKNLSLRYYNSQASAKTIINSIYGAFANKWFHFYNIDVAEAVTLQGQEIIKFSEKIINDYFINFWHKDKKLHEYLGLQEKPKSINKNCSVYIDTDSVFFTLEPAIESCGWGGDFYEFAMKVYNFRLHQYFQQCFEKFAEKRNTDNCQSFELETVANKGIWVAKKKYVQDIIWKDGKEYDRGEKISAKGLEIIQSSTPSFCREKLDNLVQMLFSDHGDVEGIVKYLSEIKEEMKYKNPDVISQNTSVGNYEKFILDDYDTLQIASGCPAHVRAAGFYNYLLNNSKHKNKYQLIRSGDKIRWYYTKNSYCTVFSYQPGAHPIEFAPDIDYEHQFEITILQPFNRIAVPTGFPKLNKELVYEVGLF